MLRTLAALVSLVALGLGGVVRADELPPGTTASEPPADALRGSPLDASAFESALRLDPPRSLVLPALPSEYLASPEISSEPVRPREPASAALGSRTAAHFGASFGGVLLGAVATGVVVGTVHAFDNDAGRARDLTLAIGGPLLLTAGATWALHRLAEARGEEVRHLPVVVGALLSAGAALAGVFVATSARDEAFVGRHWAWAAPMVALSTGFGAWVAHRLTHGTRRVQPSLGVSPTGVAAHLRVGFRR
ncbi:MAG: hypothetical protein MUE69_31810 [Myxococcota bacterium]|nr:hypothetical protein [Myxococcota bacterium]